MAADAFEEFWTRYPRKIAKGSARRSYNRAPAAHQTIMDGLERFIEATPWDDIKFCPHPATWLNQERWEDEYPVSNEFGKRMTATEALRLVSND